LIVTVIREYMRRQVNYDHIADLQLGRRFKILHDYTTMRASWLRNWKKYRRRSDPVLSTPLKIPT